MAARGDHVSPFQDRSAATPSQTAQSSLSPRSGRGEAPAAAAPPPTAPKNAIPPPDELARKMMRSMAAKPLCARLERVLLVDRSRGPEASAEPQSRRCWRPSGRATLPQLPVPEPSSPSKPSSLPSERRSSKTPRHRETRTSTGSGPTDASAFSCVPSIEVKLEASGDTDGCHSSPSISPRSGHFSQRGRSKEQGRLPSEDSNLLSPRSGGPRGCVLSDVSWREQSEQESVYSDVDGLGRKTDEFWKSYQQVADSNRGPAWQAASPVADQKLELNKEADRLRLRRLIQTRQLKAAGLEATGARRPKRVVQAESITRNLNALKAQREQLFEVRKQLMQVVEKDDTPTKAHQAIRDLFFGHAFNRGAVDGAAGLEVSSKRFALRGEDDSLCTSRVASKNPDS
eukprot:TRINITY_DN6840_c0_g1_i1.p1 TRINITY_DN6840_c0_g1~~TRINITY_DN6840_c0_g1_i1.p1  ORF type:complete len:400 (-),score=62.21 TRINITY_DN6840_c0_g1_i1:65-1264(-)